MSKVVAIIAVSIIHFAVSQTAFAQITVNLPKLPNIDLHALSPDHFARESYRIGGKKWNATAWKTAAFYWNPLTGFVGM